MIYIKQKQEEYCYSYNWLLRFKTKDTFKLIWSSKSIIKDGKTSKVYKDKAQPLGLMNQKDKKFYKINNNLDKKAICIQMVCQALDKISNKSVTGSLK